MPIDPAERVVLYQVPGQRPRHVQREPSAAGTRITWMIARLDSGAVQDFRLKPAPARREPSPRVRWREAAPGRWQALLEREPVATWDLSTAFPGLATLHAPGGSAVISDGSRATTLLEHAVHVRSVLQPSPQTLSGPVFGRLVYRSHWLGKREEKLAEELSTWTVFATHAELRLIDVELTLRATTGPVVFQSSAENSVWRLHLLEQAKSEDHRQARGQWLSPGPPAFAVWDHPANPGWPCGWRQDGGGWLHACPFAGLASLGPLIDSPRIELPLGESITWRYRLAARAGEHPARALRRHCHDFADPPRVEVVEPATHAP